MFDYYAYVNELEEEKVVAEIEKLNKKLFRLNTSSPMYSQLLDMLSTAESAYQDIQYKRRIKSEDSVINIGEIESVVTEPDYNKAELLDAIVTSYTKNFTER
jgi:hypothetical protein